MVPHQWPVALVVIWHIYLCLACSLEDIARKLSSSGKVVLGQGQVPCEFWADQQNFIFQPVAPDMIWHIYSGQCCFKGVLGMDLLSSGDVALMMGQVPCEFWGDWPTFIFQLVALDVIWYIFLHLYCSSRDGGRDLPSSGRQPLPWDRSPVSFEQISQTSFFSQWLLMWFGTFTRTCTAHWRMVVGTYHLQGRQPLPWGRSPVSFGQISLGVVFQGKSWDKGPSNLGPPRMVHHPWLAAPDLIWHIYSHLYCSSNDGGIDLPSSGEVVITMWQVPCEFRADQPTFIFQLVAPDVIWHIYSGQCCFKGVYIWTCCLKGMLPSWWGRSPVRFEEIGQPSFFSWWLQMWFGTFTCTCTAHRGMVVGTCHLQGRQSLPWGRSPVSFEQIGQTSFFSQLLLTWFGTFTPGSAA